MVFLAGIAKDNHDSKAAMEFLPASDNREADYEPVSALHPPYADRGSELASPPTDDNLTSRTCPSSCWIDLEKSGG